MEGMHNQTGPDGFDQPLTVSTTVLLLDDEEAILASLRSLLRHEGYNLRCFNDGFEALNYLKTNNVDIIVSDMRMPKLTGIEFLNKASDYCPQASRVILSGYEEKEIVISAIAKGLAQHYLMKPWEDDSFRRLLAETVDRQKKLRDNKLKELLATFSSLPAPPDFYNKLRGMLSSPDNSVGGLVSEIENSPPLVAKLLSVANSVYYGTRRPVTSVREAVVFIGTDYIANLVLAIEAFQVVSCGVKPDSFRLVEQLWENALRRAALAKLIAEQWPGLKERNVPYIASLLQDIGFVVRLFSDPLGYRKMTEMATAASISIYEADVRIFGVPHDVVGAALLQFWNLPDSIVEAVARHHRPADSNDVASILQIAELLSCGNDGVSREPAFLELASQWRERIHASQNTHM
jgi:HD-like signal output (HDOD) protein/CheY-like chemotaxis protein